MKKELLFTLCSSLIISSCYAGTYLSTQPQEAYTIEIGSAYLNPVPDGLSHHNTWREKFGFSQYISGSYNLSRKYDIKLGFDHFSKTINSRVNANTASLDSKFAIFSAGFGKTFNPDPMLILRPFLELQYAKLTDNFEVNTGLGDDLTVQGLGPKVGVDLDYSLNQSFSLTADSAVSILVSKYTSRANNAARGPHRTTPGDFRGVMTGLSFSAGGKYQKQFHSGSLALQGGWKIHYFDNAQLQTTGDITLEAFPNQALSWNGVFLSASWTAFNR